MKIALKHQWLVGRIELGLSKAEFGALTPADFRVAAEIWAEREKRKARREDELLARLAFFINLSTVPRKKGDKLPEVTDFLPTGRTKQKKRQLTSAELQAKTERVFSQLGK